jgi:hypothetical protein
VDGIFQNFPEFQVRGWSTINRSKTALLFLRSKESVDETHTTEDNMIPDLPSNMLNDPVPASLAHLSTYDLETLYWQARGHDGCYKSIALLQLFFDQYNEIQPLRVRTTTGEEFITTIGRRVIIEWELMAPKQVTLVAVRVGSESTAISYITGILDTMLHAISGFSTLDGENVSAVLDLASMQYGEVGRGRKSKEAFALESLDHFYDRLEKIAGGNDALKTKTSRRISNYPDGEWLEDVAKRVKTRWDARDTDPWCGHCGAPSLAGIKLKKCALCRVHYCNAAHQKAAWPFHKQFCTGKTGKQT